MDSLTEVVSRLRIDSEAGGPGKVQPERVCTASQVFEEIITYASSLRGSAIPEKEVEVTKQLASPFSPSGALFILQEPRNKHPWRQGVDAVISDCPTLDALEEGVQIGSEGTLSLVRNISVIDLRPFICPDVKNKSSRAELETLYSLVLKFIRAKQPDAVLCLGNEAGDKIWGWRSQLPDTAKLYTYHPSFVVNYNRRCMIKRKELLTSILEAIGYSHNSQILTIFDNRSVAAHDLDPASAWAIHILQTLAFLSFQYPDQRPPLNLTPEPGYYSLESCCRSVLNPREGEPRSLSSSIRRFFLDLNSHITLDSCGGA
ncbi:hypothetical protein BJX63DRAFT_428616 [Aspergillus granulosus]|uniref:Uracil-DNA glycosylase-like domain-containing protein n=1 Tax=Aspergillus granulosus TaxID=176169 RepID=A0ABR4HVK1_9EURO